MTVERRAALHAALAEPARLAVVDALALGEASPSELGTALGIPSNLLAHHLATLEGTGLIRRTRSQADRRRSYLHLVPEALATLLPPAVLPAPRVVFVCTHNTARSQLAAAQWTARSSVPAASAGTDPAPAVHPRTIDVARRHGLALTAPRTAHLDDVLQPDDLVVTVCDNAHEHLRRPTERRLHWSVPDPVPTDTDDAFEYTFADLATRIERLAGAVAGPAPAAAAGANGRPAAATVDQHRPA
ncbi:MULTISPECIES: arsenate reductase/protein-tyrosine-phosphatase family protein [unclassified Frankia]